MRTIKERLFGTIEEQNTRMARESFQVCEYDNKFWLTYNGALICPTDMFNDEPLSALAKIRQLYIERNTQEHRKEEY